MKEQKVRDLLAELEKDLHDRIKTLERTGLTVKNCPKCKHPVLSIADWAECYQNKCLASLSHTDA